jgi:hypothetical protein
VKGERRTSSDTSSLLPQHAALITGSAISAEVSAERGYRTVFSKTELDSLGFAKAQRRAPALLIPIFGVHGDVVTYQIRPDSPRATKEGKAIKYETVAHSRMALDVPVRVRHQLGDPSVDLFITEGARKADSAVSAGLCCIALLGVWNWRGTNESGGKTALPDWESIALNGRKVYIVFDSDVMQKAAVHSALVRLKAFLESKEATVFLVYLPVGEGAAKVGLDDYLASGKTPTDLLSCATRTLRSAPKKAGRSAPPYEEGERGLVYHKPAQDGGTTPISLCNFTARILHDVNEDDGVERRHMQEIEAHVSGRTVRFRIPSERFAGLSWVIEHMGSRAIVQPGQTIKDHLRTAIQRLSEDELTEREVYRHTGWRCIAGAPVYLHAGGALGAAGEVSGIEVALEPPLDLYRLPAPPVGQALTDAVTGCLSLLTCGLAPDRIVFPLFPFVWGVIVTELPNSVTLVGRTGARKTELAALGQRHFGPEMDAQHLPGAWDSTGNALEELAFLAKDAVLVVDDFNPHGSAQDVRRDHGKADRLLRAQGNRSGRRRMRQDLTLHAARPPRGLILSTAEESYAGQSLRARTLMIQVGRDDVNLERLSERQANGATYSLAMSGFICWVAGRRDELRAIVRSQAEQHRDALQAKAPHGRTATICGTGLALLSVFVRFAREVGAVGEREEAELLARGESAFLAVMAVQAEAQTDADPVHAFLRVLASSLGSRCSHLADAVTGEEPRRGSEVDEGIARLAGWRRATSQLDGHVRIEWTPGGNRIGFVDVDRGLAYLIPEAAYQAAQKAFGDSPERIGLGPRSLWKALEEAKLLAESDAKRHTKKVRLAGQSINVLVLRLESLSLPGSGTSGTENSGRAGEAENAGVFPISVPDPMPAVARTGTQNGNSADRPSPAQPDVPVVPDPQARERSNVCRRCGEQTLFVSPSGIGGCAVCDGVGMGDPEGGAS